MSSVAAGQPDCLNCGTALHGSFCATCGQKAADPNPTFRHLLRDAIDEFLQIDGRLWRSLRVLFLRPGFLTREHAAGRRAPYVPPLRLYLICSLAYFAVAAFAPSETSIRVEERRGRTLTVSGVQISGEVLLGNRSDAEIEARVNRALHEWLPRLMFALVPVWALLVKLVTWREGRNFPAHLYFALHVHAANFGLRAVGAGIRFAQSITLDAIWTGATFLFVVWYLTVALREVYGRSTRIAVWRAASLLAMYAAVVAVSFALFVVVALRG